MRSFVVASGLALFSATALAQQIPQCALSCFTSALSNAGCAISDPYCSCKTHGQEVTNDVTNCLVCDSTCDTSDLASVAEAASSVCVSALSASGESYAAPTTPVPTCANNTGMPAATTGGSSTAMMTDGSSSMAMGTTASEATNAAETTGPLTQTTPGAAPKITAMANYAAYAAAGLLAVGL